MRRANEVLVGATVLGALTLMVAGSIWLSQARFGGRDQIQDARFRAIGGLVKGSPVVVRGVRIGRVSNIGLAPDNWVNVTMLLNAADANKVPRRPRALISSTTLFGDWGINIVDSTDHILDDPEVKLQLAGADSEATKLRDHKWAGATLPDIGQLTAQAGRIAGDIATIAGRVANTFDTSTARRIQSAFLDLSNLSRRMSIIVRSQETTLTAIGRNLDTGTTSLRHSAQLLERTLARADSATSREQLQRILSHTDTVTSDLREVASNLRSVTGAARDQQAAITRIIQNTDSILAGFQAGHGTIGKLAKDSTLYNETVSAVRQLRDMLADMKSNPRRYFSFSVF